MDPNRPANATTEFLGYWFNWEKAKIFLDDVHPLTGGVRLSILGHDYYVERVWPGKKVEKYRVVMTTQERRFLINLFLDQDFCTIHPPERLGIADEARPLITLQNKARKQHVVAKWAGVPDERFDLLYRALLALAEQTDRGRLLRPKFNEWQKGVAILGVILVALLPFVPGFWIGRWLTNALWSPEQLRPLFVVYGLLWLFIPAAAGGFSWLERHRPASERLFAPNPLLAVVSLLHVVNFYLLLDLIWDPEVAAAVFIGASLSGSLLLLIALWFGGPWVVDHVIDRF